jgi:membrane-associated protease RseP (regulator of RpoE activity)
MRWEPLRVTAPSPGFVVEYGESYVRRSILANYGQGLHYMLCVMSILLAHEMGHFLATLRYRIPASLPYFLPFPIAPIGTMGAVIGMEGQRANRREIFDIGLAGPIAGLVVAVPILWIGIGQLDLTGAPHGNFRYDCPLLVRWMIGQQHPDQAQLDLLRTSQVNPCFMAGWVGLLITGLNMLPVSQLDGGHVTYTLFGRNAHWLARLFVVGAIAYIWYARAMVWSLMVVLVLFIGTDHPPTADDRVPLGWPRTLLGLASLSIPVLCFPPRGLMVL